jgi:hypothetical protein
MTYILEEIQEADRNNILKDAVNDERKLKTLNWGAKNFDFPKVRAINRKNGFYLTLAPILLPEEVRERPYYFFANGKIYEIRSKGLVGMQAYFAGEIPESEIQNEIKDAFSIFGRWGTGAFDSYGHQTNTFIPEFKDGV